MKKAIILFALLCISVCATACNRAEDHDMDTYSHNFLQDSVRTYDGPVIPNEECAIAVAEVIYNNMAKSEDKRNYTPQYVYFDEENEAWIVSFWEESSSTTLGDDCSIAIQKEDGKVLRIWFGE